MINAIETNQLCKEYPGVKANEDVSIQVERGTVMCIVGENGAGKSTLMNMLYGLEKPTRGTIAVNGKTVHFESSREAMKHGIGMVHQHFMLVKELSVLENIILGSEPRNGWKLDYKKAERELTELGEAYGMNVPLHMPAGNLPVGIQQKVEILKTLYRKAEILILDEPTAVLTPQETEELFRNIEFLSSQGKTMILITHKLDEVMRISRDIVVMRKGKVTGILKTSETSVQQLAEAMVGRKLPQMAERKHVELDECLYAKDVCTKKHAGGFGLKKINFIIKKGEILGVAGISGNGQVELAKVIAGTGLADSGKLILEGNDITNDNRRKKMLAGISYISEDRMEESLCTDWSIELNAVAGYHILPQYLKRFGFMNGEAVKKEAKKLIEQFNVKATGEEVLVGTLSGGNQQKIVVARETIHGPKLIIASEPTRGVDIGAISFIHNHLISLRNKGTSIVLISSDLDEIFKLSDRIMIMFEGEIAAVVSPKEVTREEIGLYMSGVKRGKQG